MNLIPPFLRTKPEPAPSARYTRSSREAVRQAGKYIGMHQLLADELHASKSIRAHLPTARLMAETWRRG